MKPYLKICSDGRTDGWSCGHDKTRDSRPLSRVLFVHWAKRRIQFNFTESLTQFR